MVYPVPPIEGVSQAVKALAVVGVVFLCVIAAVVGVLFYTAYKQVKIDDKNSTLTR